MPRLVFDDPPNNIGLKMDDGTYVAPPNAPQAVNPSVSYADDFARSLAAGVGRGVASVPGFLGDLQVMGETAAQWGRGKIAGPEAEEELRRQHQADPRILPTTEEIVRKVEPVLPGIAYKPQTTLGEYTRTGTEFGTGAAITGLPNALLSAARTVPSLARTALTTGMVPGLASEGAGQATEGTAAEPYARGGAALLAGGVAGVAGPGTAEEIVTRAARGVSPQQLTEAEELFNRANAMGVPMTRAMAVQHVTDGATNLGDMQRVVEGAGGMRGHFAPTEQGIATAGRDAFNAIVPATPQQGLVGPRAGTAAEEATGRVNARINQITRPLYDAAESQTIDPADLARLQADPVYRQTVETLYSHPELQRRTAGMPEDSVEFQDLVKRHMDARLNTPDPGRSLDPVHREGVATPRGEVVDAATTASPEYRQALAEQTRLRQRYLEPLMAGPLGRMAGRDTTTAQAVEALFPGGRIQPSSAEVSRAVSALANSSNGDWAARQLVRTYLQSTLDASSRSGQWQGASFANRVARNPQMRENLQAAITSLPNGRETWDGFNRFLEVMEATGQRQRPGSGTSFNNEMLQDMGRGPAVPTVSRFNERLQRMNMAGNTDAIADLLTNPRMAGRFRDLALAPPGSAKAIRLAVSLAATAQRSQNADEEYQPGQSLAAPRTKRLRFD